MKLKKTTVFALTLALGACMLAGCAKGPATDGIGDPNDPPAPSGDGVYTVTFNANGGTLTGAASVNTVNGNITDMPTDPTRANYEFKGWNLKQDGTGAQVTTMTVFTEDTTVYAKWDGGTPTPPTPTGAYKITFDANGGSWTATAPEVTTEGGRIATMPTAKPTRANYEFVGWNLKDDGTGAAVTVATPFTEATTVFAEWFAIPADPSVQKIGASGVWLVGEGLAGGGWDYGVQFTQKGDVWVLYMTVSTDWIKVRGGEYYESGCYTLVDTDSSVAYNAPDGFEGFNILVNSPGRYKFIFDGTAVKVEAL